MSHAFAHALMTALYVKHPLEIGTSCARSLGLHATTERGPIHTDSTHHRNGRLQCHLSVSTKIHLSKGLGANDDAGEKCDWVGITQDNTINSTKTRKITGLEVQ